MTERWPAYLTALRAPQPWWKDAVVRGRHTAMIIDRIWDENRRHAQVEREAMLALDVIDAERRAADVAMAHAWFAKRAAQRAALPWYRRWFA